MIYFILTFLFIMSAWILILKLMFNKIMNDCLFGDFLQSNYFARFKAGIRIIIKDVITDVKNGCLSQMEQTSVSDRVGKNSENYAVPILETQGAPAYRPIDFVSSPPKEIGAIVEGNIQQRNSRRRAYQGPAIRLPIPLPRRAPIPLPRRVPAPLNHYQVNLL